MYKFYKGPHFIEAISLPSVVLMAYLRADASQRLVLHLFKKIKIKLQQQMEKQGNFLALVFTP